MRISDWPTVAKQLDGTTAQIIFCSGGSETVDSDLTPSEMENIAQAGVFSLTEFLMIQSSLCALDDCQIWTGPLSPILFPVTFVSSSCF